MQHLGFVEAVTEAAAIEAAVTLFGLDDAQRNFANAQVTGPGTSPLVRQKRKFSNESGAG